MSYTLYSFVLTDLLSLLVQIVSNHSIVTYILYNV